MSVKFGNDGTLYCNTVKYNWKQARNMIADGSYGNISGSTVWAGVAPSTSPAGYKAFRSFKVTSSTTQKLPKLFANHKYYFSCRYMSNDSTQCYLGIRNNGSDLGNVYTGKTSGNWVLGSRIYNISTDINKDVGDVCIWVGNGTVYSNQFILIDLTDTFGSSFEPTKEWCDNNIREHEVFVNYGCVASAITSSNYETAWDATISSQPSAVGRFNYLYLDSNWEPRDYMYMWGLNTGTTNGSGIVSKAKFSFVKSRQFYFYYDGHYNKDETPITGRWTTFNFPNGYTFNSGSSAQTFVYGKEYSGGGGMNEWKRISCFGSNNSQANVSAQAKIYLNNNKIAGYVRATALNIINASSPLTQYNNYNGTSLSISDINKEWCDRWIDGRSSPIIHIKNHRNTKIRFNAPMQEMKKESIPTYSKEALDNTIGLKNHGWLNIINASELRVGDRAWIQFTVSDTGNIGRFVVKVNSVSGNTVYCDNLGWDYSGVWYKETLGYDVICNDIEIRPELNKIVFDKTGTIKCKKLVKNTNY